MANDGQSGRESTRREYLQYGGAVIAGGLLAGCTGGSGSETTTTASEPETTTAATTEAATETETETTTEAAESYSVSIEPVGEVTFDSVPEAWIANNGSWADMGVALGLDTPMGVWLPGRYHTQYYDEIPDVSVDKSSIRQLWGDSGVGKEQFYELNADVHIADPNFLLNRGQWSEADIEEISTQVVWAGGDEPEEFYPYVIDEGTSFKHLNDLKVNDALATTEVRDFYSNRGAVDFETLLEVDPEVLLVRGQEAKTREEFQNTVVSFMENHEVAGELTAVQNGDVYRAGALYQGPITNLVVTDRLARTLYDADERLFDAQRVADIANGNL